MFIVKGHGYQQDKQTRVERLFHKMLRVDVLYQLLLFTEAPHTVAALKEFSLRPRWLSFICFLWRSADYCQGWINCEYCCIQIRNLFFAPKFDICALLKPYTPEFQGCGLSFLSLSTSTPSIGLVISTLPPLPLPPCLSALGRGGTDPPKNDKIFRKLKLTGIFRCSFMFKNRGKWFLSKS